jgi:hypothetical protein
MASYYYLLIQLCLVHTTARYDKVFRGPSGPEVCPRWELSLASPMLALP